MDYAKYWASAVATADLGEPIDQSLRFRSGGSSTGHLSKTITTSASTSAITISFWVKLGDIGNPSTGGSNFIFSSGTGGGDSGNIYYDRTNQNIRFQDTSSYTGFTTQKLRDLSAWYHIVYRFDAANQYGKVYVNGQEHSSTSIATSEKSSFGAQTPMQIGRYATGTAGSYQNNRFSGYLAEFNMLFGSSLAPDNFGRTNDDGVWVPKSLSDLTSNQYGALGFRHVFDSSAGLGDDTAPTGGTHASANDFTATGFDTADVALYSSGLAASSAGSYESNAGSRTLEVISPEQAFDGNLAAQCQANGSAAWLYWTTNISCSTVTLIVNNDTDQTPAAIYINGSSVTVPTPTLNGSNYESTVSVSGGTLTEFAFKNQGGPNTSIFGMKVDGGSVLVDNTNNDVDFFDTPTSNFSTLNPLAPVNNGSFPGSSTAFQEARLKGNSSGISSGGPWNSTMAISGNDTNTYYWEMEVLAVGSSTFPRIGVIIAPPINQGFTITPSYLYYSANGTIKQNPDNVHGVATTLATAASFVAGDIVSISLNTSTDTITWFKNGTQQYQHTSYDFGNQLTQPVFGQTGAGESFRVNYGQMPFLYEPANITKLQTNNLPEPTIKNGKEHFDTVTYTGASGAKTVTGLEFQPDLIWFKSTSHSTGHAWFDSVRGASAGYVSSSAQDGEGTSNGTLTSFNSDGFTTGVPVLNEFNNGGGRNYVAWCWKAGGAAVSNGNGSITSSVSANTDAGFSIVSYTGTGSAATIGHGLSSPPEFILGRNRDTTTDWCVYHVAADTTAPETKNFAINATDAVGTADVWNNTAPTATVFSVKDAVQNNGNTNDIVAYCWHSVEGFSKFGRFKGNSNADGQFVYLGFRPSLIIWKSTSGGTDWQMRDIERDGEVNPVNLTLYPNGTASEYSGASADVDFLSNGFKMRTGDTNVNGGTMLYMAWAEHPFGGENVPPATAR